MGKDWEFPGEKCGLFTQVVEEEKRDDIIMKPLWNIMVDRIFMELFYVLISSWKVNIHWEEYLLYYYTDISLTFAHTCT